MATTPSSSRLVLWHSESGYSKFAPQPGIHTTEQALEQINSIIERCNKFLAGQKRSLPWHQHFHVRNRPYNYLNPVDIMDQLKAVKTWLQSLNNQTELVNNIDTFIKNLNSAVRLSTKIKASKKASASASAWKKKLHTTYITSDILEQAANDPTGNAFSEWANEAVVSITCLLFGGLLAAIFALSSAGFPMVALIPIIPLAITLIIGACVEYQAAKNINTKQYGPVRTAFENFLNEKPEPGASTGIERLEHIKSGISKISQSDAPEEPAATI